MSSKDRQSGYYWVRFNFGGEFSPWRIAEWVGRQWWMAGHADGTIKDDDFVNIGPMVTMPDGLPTNAYERD